MVGYLYPFLKRSAYLPKYCTVYVAKCDTAAVNLVARRCEALTK